MKQNSKLLSKIEGELSKCSQFINLNRQVRLLKNLVHDAEFPEDKANRMQAILNDMEEIYSTANITVGKKQLQLEPDIEDLFGCSRDPKTLLNIWVAWRDATGRKIKPYFIEYVDLMNEQAKFQGFSKASEFMLESYEDSQIVKKVAHLWYEVEPLYQQLHAYVRRKLSQFYNSTTIDRQGPLPPHLLGNLWSQSWVNIYDITRPFPEVTLPSITKMLKDKKFTPQRMFLEAENFFRSINLPKMPPEFWNKSIFEKKKGVDMVCHASAWDMYYDDDFRIKMCTSVTVEDFITIHHEMGHLQYSMQYKNQPGIFRDGANPGFHEAIGDVIALSVSSLTHMRKLNLLKRRKNKDPGYDRIKEDINFLYWMALQKVVFLPYALCVSEFQIRTLDRAINTNDLNDFWWHLRGAYQGLKPSVTRTNEDFDPGAKFHIAAGVEYFRYFVAHIIQFQFHEALCKVAGFGNEPLHRCDIYGHIDAGERLKKMLKMGHSAPWPEAMKVILQDKDDMSSESILNYFKPLHIWLQQENKRTGEKIGW